MKKSVLGSRNLRLKEVSYPRQQSYFAGGSVLAKAEAADFGNAKMWVGPGDAHPADDG